jgi:4-hydroxy-2-oxoheptanedioate aldolase
MQKLLQDSVTRLEAVGKPAGILTTNEDEARRYIGWGYVFVAVGSDVGLLARGADALAKRFKS